MKNIKYISFLVVTAGILSACSNSNPFLQEDFLTNGENTTLNEFFTEGTKKTEVKVISGMVQDSDEEGLTIDEAFGTNGELLLPFDQAFPYYMQNTKYDANSILVKCDNYDVFSVYRALSLNGVTGYEEIVKVDNDTSWYKLFLKDITSKKAINLFRSLNTKAQIFDLNYIIDNSSLTENVDSSTLNPIQKSGETTIDNCGIDNANKNKYFKEQWYFKEIGLKEAYKEMKNSGLPEGGLGTVVAVIDTGVDIKHEDLRNNIWVNSLEVPNNGIDDDNNGYIDDVNGWNFVDENNNPDDDQGHGTHVAGIIGAENNNVGVVGIAYKTKIMPLKAGDGAGYFTQDRIASAIVYAYMNGADIINMSFGGSTCSLAVLDALEAAYTTSVLVAAAGNNGCSNDLLPSYPAALSHVLGVMSIDQVFKESKFSNYDLVALDQVEYEVYAPGEGIYSTIPNNRYLSLSGTSMSTPIVSGIVALLKSARNDASLYPTKYFMGQISASNSHEPDCIHRDPHNIPNIVDAYDSLTKTPSPFVTFTDYYIFDGKDISENNNNDGTLDAGETVYFAPIIFNRWGKAAGVVLNFDTKSSISGEESKYVTLENDIIEFGDVGTYSTKDFLIYDDFKSSPIGTDFNKCLKINIQNDVPNNVSIPLNINISCFNGMDLLDLNVYESQILTVNLRINKGVNLPKLIKEDMTLTSDKLWIVNEIVQIGDEATLSIDPGTEIMFGSTESSQVFGGQRNSPSLIVYGNLFANGTASNMISITTAETKYNDFISISGTDIGNNYSMGTIELEYCNISGPMNLRATAIKHCNIEASYEPLALLVDGSENYSIHTNFNLNLVENSKINLTKLQSSWDVSTDFVINESKNNVIILSNYGNDNFIVYFTVRTVCNTTFITKGHGPLSLIFRITQASGVINGEFHASEHIFNSPKVNLLSIRTINEYNEPLIKGGVVEAFEFASSVSNKLYEDKNIKINCPYNEHMTENCKCSFANNTYIPFLFNKEYVCFLDGSKIEIEEFLSFFMENDKNIVPIGSVILEDTFKCGVIRWQKNHTYESESYVWIDFNMLSVDLLYGHATNNYTDGRNIFTDEELKNAKTAYNVFVKEAALKGWASGGGTTSENINILASNISSQIKVDVEEDKLFEGYTYQDLFNFNTENDEITDYIVNDGNDSFYKPNIGLTDENHEGNASLWPYVTKLELRNENGERTNTFANEELNITIHLNREMDTNVPIRVRFGSYGVYADYEIEGKYIDSKTWEGKYTLNTLIESGTQYFNISGGAALSDGFMDIEEAPGRFSFVIDTAQSLSKTISGISNEEGILLSWMQDDFGIDTIMGYNIYRSNEENGNYTKINKSIISKDENEFLDTNVMPGEAYWYTFTVVLSDFTESSPAGKISVTAMDTMSPNIYHNPVYEAYTGSKLTISCLISDNIGVENAYLYYRKAGETTYKRILMNSSNNRFTASISASELSLEGIEYYIEASDGTNIVSKGTADNPYYVMIRDSALIDTIGDVDGDGEITVKDAYLILQHIYGEILLTGDSFTRADLNSDGKLSTSEAYRILQYINGNITSLTY